MKTKNKPTRLLVSGVLLALAETAAQAQTPQPLPRDQYGAVIMPPPQPEQREQGKQLLEKVLSVVLTIPLSEPEQFIRALGFEESRAKVYADHESIVGLGKSTTSGLGNPFIMKHTKLPPDSKKAPYYYGSTIQAHSSCIHIEDVTARLKPLAKAVETRDSVRIHPYPQAPQQKIDRLIFRWLSHPGGQISNIIFMFDYQFCANDIVVNFIPAQSGAQP